MWSGDLLSFVDLTTDPVLEMSKLPGAKESDIEHGFSKAPERAPRDTGEIRSLQYGRGVAALLVCLFHYEGAKVQLQAKFDDAVDTNLHFIFGAGHSGVEFFFVLSGFIIFHAHRNDLSWPERFGTFYWKRAIRILPMFWFIVAPFGFAVLVLSSSGLLTPEKFLLDLLLIPREGTLTLPAAWTLQHEVVFYALFGLLILNKWLGLVALTLWQLACLNCSRLRLTAAGLPSAGNHILGIL